MGLVRPPAPPAPPPKKEPEQRVVVHFTPRPPQPEWERLRALAEGCERREASVLLTQFLLFAQTKGSGFWLHEMPFGEPPRRLSALGALGLVREFVALLERVA